MNKSKKINIKGIVTILFLIVTVFFFFSIIIMYVTDTTEKPQNGAMTVRNWSNDYPFESNDSSDFVDTSDASEEENTVKNAFKIREYVSTFSSIKDTVESHASDLLLGRMKFVELNALINKNIGMKLITGSDNVVVMNNGHLTYQAFEIDTTYPAQSTKKLNDYLEEKGINFLYVQCPSKENKIDNELPKGITDYYNINADALLEKLNKYGVNTLDLRPLLNAEFDDWYSCFFKTDHHWKPETGVWAAGKIAEYLNDKFSSGIDESLGNINNYNIDVYKDWSLGSLGKKVSMIYGCPEDFDVVYPKASTMFTVNYDDKMTIKGAYNKALLDMSRLDKIDYYSISSYTTYLYGNTSIVRIHNDNLNNGKRVLFIGDSFTLCLAPSMALGVEYLDVLDIRHFNGSVIYFIETFNPDTVIVNYNPSSISDTKTKYSTFNFE